MDLTKTALFSGGPSLIRHRTNVVPFVPFGAVEVDVIASREGVPFVHHNYIVEGVGFAHRSSSRDLLAAGVLPLSEYLDRVANHVEVVMIDLKSGFHEPLVPHRAVARLLDGSGWLGRAIVVDWDWEQAAALKAEAPELCVGAALRGRIPRLASILVDAPIDYLYMEWDLIRKSDVEACRSQGILLGVFEGWDPAFYQAALDFGVNVILTDDPRSCGARLLEALD